MEAGPCWLPEQGGLAASPSGGSQVSCGAGCVDKLLAGDLFVLLERALDSKQGDCPGLLQSPGRIPVNIHTQAD